MMDWNGFKTWRDYQFWNGEYEEYLDSLGLNRDGVNVMLLTGLIANRKVQMLDGLTGRFIGG